MYKVEVTRVIPAPVEAVWARYTDHLSWNQWAGLGTVTLGRRGESSPNGVGCVRVISTLGFAVHEEVVEFEAPRRMAYRLIRGLVPMREHLGEVEFAAQDGGTLITWRCRFESTIPGLGGLSQRLISKLFRDALAGLARTYQ